MTLNCHFCSIVNGNIEAEVVLRNDFVTAFLDWKPINPGHLLVVPNVHEPDFEVLAPATIGRVMEAVQSLSKILKCIYRPRKVGLRSQVSTSLIATCMSFPYTITTISRRDIWLEGTLQRAAVDDLRKSAATIRNALGLDS